MVAKSYQGLEIVQGEYKKNGKSYVMIKTKSGGLKEVRWYSPQEYAKMYPDVQEDKSKDPYYRPQKYVLGFEKGYITIFRGVKEEHEEWFKQSICRFARWWGWYVPSTKEVPKDLPAGVTPVKLFWDPMGNEEEWLKDEITVKNHVRKTLMDSMKPAEREAVSTYQGEVGDRLDIVVKIISKDAVENKRFNKFTYTYEMEDETGNYYKWTTQAKDWSCGTKHHIRGTVKEFDEVMGEEATVLTRCVEV